MRDQQSANADSGRQDGPTHPNDASDKAARPQHALPAVDCRPHPLQVATFRAAADSGSRLNENSPHSSILWRRRQRGCPNRQSEFCHCFGNLPGIRYGAPQYPQMYRPHCR
jgi:hypothetical protein